MGLKKNLKFKICIVKFVLVGLTFGVFPILRDKKYFIMQLCDRPGLGRLEGVMLSDVGAIASQQSVLPYRIADIKPYFHN